MSTEKSPALSACTHDAPGGPKPPLALIAGPTASGKSDVAVQLALWIREAGREAVVINADSAQVYRDLAILSARPSADEMQGIPHRLLGTWDGAAACSAADWAAAAREEVAEAHDAGTIPILVGGTGLYMRTLLDGIAPVPEIDAEIRREVRALPLDQAYRALLREDPERAAALAPADSSRICRSLEVIRSTGRSLLDWQAQRIGGIGESVDLTAAVLLPDRQELYERCNRRFAQMLERGAIVEVEKLLARRLDPALPVMRAIGVPEIADHLRGQLPIEAAQERGSQATRNYAKRQYTWFRRQPPPSWTAIMDLDFNAAAICERLLYSSSLTRHLT